ncbi:MAG: hypothetical protein E7062_01370, partial [Spirochaetaceae bacterium]|nr:hypothetical protein [Spirochaetaceae bacterium]
MYRIYIERKPGFQNEAERLFSELSDFLGIKSLKSLRYLNRYDIENVQDAIAEKASIRIFSEPQSDSVFFTHIPLNPEDTVIAWEYLPGQYDQRSDSAQQCISLLQAEIT